MNLLFQKTAAGNTELKELLGFIDADLKIKNLLPDIITATNDVIDLIGQKVYDKAVTLYSNNNIAAENAPFIFAVRYPIAVNAYRLYAPSNDVSHTNNGRKLRQDENEKLPFEWMLDRDNKSLEKRYYRALDDLIKFLDNSKIEEETPDSIFTIWTASDAYKKTHESFIRTVADFDSFFPIQSRLLLIKLMPGILDCERYEILPRIGQKKITALKELVKTTSGNSEASDLELIRLIRKASVSYSLAWAMTRLSVQLFPEGVLQHYTSDRATTQGQKPSLKSEPEAARQAFQDDMKRALLEIETLMAPKPTVDDSFNVIPEQQYGDKYMST